MQKTAEFEKRIGRKMEGWWMGLTGRIDDGLLEIIRTIDEEQKNEEREDRQRRKPETRQEGTGIKLFICYNLMYAQTMY